MEMIHPIKFEISIEIYIFIHENKLSTFIITLNKSEIIEKFIITVIGLIR